MRRALTTSLVTCLAFTLALPTIALGTSPSPLSMIPEDAIAFACVQNLQQTDSRVASLVQELGVGPMIPPTYRSLVTLLREYGPMGDGLDENGALALVVLAAETPDQLGEKSGLIVQATDAQALLESMSPEASDDGTSKVMLFGNVSYALTTEGAVVIAPSPEAAKALARRGKGITSKLKEQELSAVSEMDLALWANTAEGMKLFKPALDDFLGSFKAMSGAEEGTLGAIQADAMTENIDMFREGATSMCAGLTLGKGGLGLRFGLSLKQGSKLARMSGVLKPTKSSMLAGLPAENFVFAIGQQVDPDQAQEGVKQLSKYLEAKEIKQALGEEKAGQLKEKLEQWYGTLRGFAFSVSSLPPGPEGLVGVCAVCKVGDSGQWLDHLGSMIELAKGIESEDAEVKALLSAIQFKKEAATIGGASVATLALDLSAIEDVEAEDLDQLTKIVGQDGVLFRMSAVDATHVAMAFGGGEERMGRIVAMAKSGDSPLAKDAGIVRVADHVPAAKLSEGYVAVDRIVGLVRNLMEAIGEGDQFPFSMGDLNAPLALVSTGGSGYIDVHVYMPMELIVAVKNTAMQAMGMMMGGGQGDQGGPPSGMDEEENDEPSEDPGD